MQHENQRDGLGGISSRGYGDNSALGGNISAEAHAAKATAILTGEQNSGIGAYRYGNGSGSRQINSVGVCLWGNIDFIMKNIAGNSDIADHATGSGGGSG